MNEPMCGSDSRRRLTEHPKIEYAMKRLLVPLALISSLLFSVDAFAQPTFYFPTQTLANNGEQVSLPLKVRDFTDLLGVQFSITWDPEVLSFVQVTNLHPAVTGLDIGDFDFSAAADGVITFNWDNGQNCQSAVSGVTLDDEVTLFELRFQAIGGYGAHTYVNITDQPLDMIVHRLNANCMDIGEFITPGWVSIEVLPLRLIGSSTSGNTGEVVCVDYAVEGFQNLISVQFSVNWNPNMLEFVSSSTSNLEDFQVNEMMAFDGVLTANWFDPNKEITLADGTVVLTLCFEIKGSCGQSASIDITDDPTIIDVVNGLSQGQDIGLLPQSGQVTVNCFDPDGMTLNVEDKVVNVGEVFTVDVTVEDFVNINKLFATLQWNPGIIELQNWTVGNHNLFLFGSSINQAGPAHLTIEWDNSFSLGSTLSDGTVLLTLTFRAVGPGGSNSMVAVVNDPVAICVNQFSTGEIGLNTNNGLVEIRPTVGLTATFPTLNANPGENVCVDVSVQDFTDLTRAAFSMTWETDVLEFVSVTDGGPLALDAFGNFNTLVTANGALGFEWENPAGTTLADGTTIFQVCFEVVGNPGTCSPLQFGEIPNPVDVQTTSSNGFNVGLNGISGELCVLNPLNFQTSISDIFSVPGAQACLDFSVQNFEQLTTLQYSINWNPLHLVYDTLLITGTLPGFDQTSFDDNLTLTEDGRLLIHWQAEDALFGESVPDGTVIFQLCFEMTTAALDCNPVAITSDPQNIVVKSASTGSANIGMSVDPGSVCKSDFIAVVDAQIAPVTCANAPVGGINITVEGGSGSYTFNWSGPGIINPNQEDQAGLVNATYFVTVTDAADPSLQTTASFTVPLAPDAIRADAGRDTSLNCSSPLLTLDGSNSSQGPDITYFWEGLDLGTVKPGDETTLMPVIFGSGRFVLTVTDNFSGCVSTDTVEVRAAVIPNAVALPETAVIKCNPDSLVLDGSPSSNGFEFLWSTTDGSIRPGTETQEQATVLAPGTYVLTVFSTLSNCSNTDTVVVSGDLEKPVADAGADAALGCNDDSTPIGGGMTSTGPDFTYQWTPLNGGDICGPNDAPTADACAAGLYELLVTDTTNGCTQTDTVEVQADTLKPFVFAGPDTSITCLVNVLELAGSASAQDPNDNLSIEWTAANGGNILSGGTTLNPQIDAPGSYTLRVTNQDNGCSAISTLIVEDLRQEVQVEAGPAQTLTCNTTLLTLDGSQSAAGSGISYLWTDAGGQTLSDSLTAEVDAPGLYYLTVTNAANGCSSTDSVEVLDGTTPPPVSIEMNGDTILTCAQDELILTGMTDTGNPDIVFLWTGPGVGCVTGGSTLTPTVSCAGVYFLEVRNNATGCLNRDSVLITEDKVKPQVTVQVNDTLTCARTSVQIQGFTDAVDFQASWASSPPGATIQDPTTLNPTVFAPGVYVLTVQNNQNGCISSKPVTVLANTTQPEIVIEGSLELDCSTPSTQLDAGGSTPANGQFSWTAIQGEIPAGMENQPLIEVGPGLYSLLLTDPANGCTATSEVEVTLVGEIPTAVLPLQEVEKPCDQPTVLLDGSASSSGATIVYEWELVGSGPLGVSTPTLEASAAGLYILTVRDTAGGCSASDSVTVVFAQGGEPADAQVDFEPCTDEAFLLGNLPPGASGQWSTLQGALIENPDSAATPATQLAPGENTFIWTLSIGTCTNYSSDTVRITVDQTKPQAFDDFLTAQQGTFDSLSVDATQNDFIQGDFLFTVLDQPPTGTLSFTAEGRVVFVPEETFSGQAQVTYSICNPECPDLCDTGLITFLVERDPSIPGPEVPNGITPNGDGLNDELVFDVLLNNPDEFPNNELIIFNRWGDIVFRAKPYLNDWQGTNNAGQPLPHGTYYYILRLDLSERNIIRGDVTILK